MPRPSRLQQHHTTTPKFFETHTHKQAHTDKKSEEIFKYQIAFISIDPKIPPIADGDHGGEGHVTQCNKPNEPPPNPNRISFSHRRRTPTSANLQFPIPAVLLATWAVHVWGKGCEWSLPSNGASSVKSLNTHHTAKCTHGISKSSKHNAERRTA